MRKFKSNLLPKDIFKSSNTTKNDFSKILPKNSPKKIPEISNFGKNQKNKNALYQMPMNNIFNSMYNFLFLPNFQKFLPKSKLPPNKKAGFAKSKYV